MWPIIDYNFSLRIMIIKIYETKFPEKWKIHNCPHMKHKNDTQLGMNQVISEHMSCTHIHTLNTFFVIFFQYESMKKRLKMKENLKNEWKIIFGRSVLWIIFIYLHNYPQIPYKRLLFGNSSFLSIFFTFLITFFKILLF